MRRLSSFHELAGVIGIASLAAVHVAAGQRAAKTPASTTKGVAKRAPAKTTTGRIPRTADGRPDLQGVWSFATITPLERPTELKDKQVLTEQEAAEFEKRIIAREDKDNREGTGTEADVSRAYNDFWWDRGTRVVGTRRTSLIVDPPDGRIPSFTPEGQKRVAALAERMRRSPSGPEDRNLGERCILGFNSGPPMFPSAYNNNVQLVQTADHLGILNEMVHNARVVPLDGRPHGTIRQWVGDSRGRWDGDTLVVDTINFSSSTTLRGSSPNMHLVERFTRVNANTLVYAFTVDDATTWTRPWTAEVPMTKSNEPMFEYACHEGNYGMTGILAGARADEKAAEAARKK
jgi:hypothetical protein